jgi:Flp pilus assembly secretin CpaC
MGKGGLFQTVSPFAKISVGDDKVVEVMPQSDREFVLNPKGAGSTNVFVFDEKSKLVANLDVAVLSNFETFHEPPRDDSAGKVRVYNRIYDKQGALVRPATYRCNGTNCETVSEPPSMASPVLPATMGAEPGAAAPNDAPR